MRLRSRSNTVAQQKKRGGRSNAKTKASDRGVLTDEATRLRSRRNAPAAEMRGLKRQTGGADGRSNAVGCRRNAEGAEMRGLKRQTRDADERSNAVGSRRNAPAAERRSAGLSGRWRAAVSRRQLAAPAPLLSIINLARALFPTAGAFSLCSPPRSLQWHNLSPIRPLTAARAFAHLPATSTPCAPSSSRYTAFLLLLRTAAARSPTTRAFTCLQGK